MQRASKRVNPPALILGQGITALGALRALAEAGKRCFVTATDDPIVAESRWYQPAPGSEHFSELGVTPDTLRQLDFDRAVLIPCSDNAALAVARLDAERPENLYACVSPEDTLLLFQDKQRFAELLSDLRVPHPHTFVIGQESDIDSLDAEIFSHAFLKPVDSQSFIAHYGVKAFWIDNKSSAIARWQSIHESGFETVLQEYVPGHASDHCFIDGFVDSKGRTCGRFARRRLRMDPPDFGNSTLMESVPLAEVSAAADSLAKVLESTGYKGIFSAEFKRDSRTGEFRLLEVNTRAWWYVDFARRCGVDVCSMAYDDALGRPVGVVSGYVTRKRCVYPHRDLRAYRNARKIAPVSLIKWCMPWFGALQPVFRFKDPMPAILATLKILRGFVARRAPSPRRFIGWAKARARR